MATSTPPRSSAWNVSAADVWIAAPPTYWVQRSQIEPAERNLSPLRSSGFSIGFLEISEYGVVEYGTVNTRPLEVYSSRQGWQCRTTNSVPAAVTASGLSESIAKFEMSWA